MADPEIDVVRKILASHPRPTNLAERRRRLDALGAQYSLPEDVRVEGVDARLSIRSWLRWAMPSRVIDFCFRAASGRSGSLWPVKAPGAVWRSRCWCQRAMRDWSCRPARGAVRRGWIWACPEEA